MRQSQSSSAGALVDGLKVTRAKKIVVLAPYIKPLTKLIVDYIVNEGYDVLDYVALEIPHNLDVARHDEKRVARHHAGYEHRKC